MEYGLDLNPLSFSSLPAPVDAPGGQLLTYNKGTAAATDSKITYVIETSAALSGSWSPLTPITNNSNQISALIPANDPSGRLFGRLRVTKSN